MKKIAIIVIALIIIGGFGFGLFKLNKVLQKPNTPTTKSKVTQEKTSTTNTSSINLNTISNSEILSVANGSMSNVAYTFKSVLNKEISNDQLNVILLGFMEQDGKYITKRIDVSLQVVTNPNSSNQSLQVVPGSFQNDTTPSNNSNNLNAKESAINTVVNYLNSQSYNINATNWAVDAFPNQTIGQYSGNLVHVYETFDGNPKSVGWYLVGNDGVLYNAGATGNGPISAT
ncbi:MAG: hypothetical protein ACRCWG_06075 [Sarcina sp.]